MVKRLITSFVTAVLLALPGFTALSCSGPADKSLKIAYNVAWDTDKDDYEIFSMNLDGSGKKNISNSPGVDWVYYASGERLYFVSDRDTTHRMLFLYEMDSEGNNVRKICPFPLEDSWMTSRNGGAELVVNGRRDGLRHTLYMIDSTGKILRQLTDDTAAYHADPSFSPDGSEIVYRYRARKTNREEPDELWIMDLETGSKRQLTHYPEGDTSVKRHDYHAGPPFWEPNRNVISYASRQRGNYSIYSIRPDGSGLTQLTPDSMNQVYHAWSPDGTLLVYDASDLGETSYDIYTMNTDGTGVRKLTDDARFEQCPVFVLAAGH